MKIPISIKEGIRSTTTSNRLQLQQLTMNTHQALFFITAAMAVTSSMPFSNYWDTKTQLQHQTTLLLQRDLGRTFSWLPHTTKENKNSHVRSLVLVFYPTHFDHVASIFLECPSAVSHGLVFLTTFCFETEQIINLGNIVN